jgi:mRNA-degrading endonuclease toxin of MazEF toxin-antitoxin module
MTINTAPPRVDGLINTVFEVEPAKPHLTLDPKSLVNLGKIHTVDFRDRVKFLGRLTPASVADLQRVWRRLNDVDNLTDIDPSMAP